MKESTRRKKEGLMLQAASRIMQKKGLSNFTMEEVAQEANITKVTLYTYFSSKENLTMAVCHSIYEKLYDRLIGLETLIAKEKGLEAIIKVKSSILSFISELPFRAIMIMEFLSIYRLSDDKLSEAMASSPFRLQLNNETNKITEVLTRQLEKGRRDGSMLNKSDNQTLLLYMWNCMSGFISLTSTPGFQEEKSQSTLKRLADFHEIAARLVLSSDTGISAEKLSV